MKGFECLNQNKEIIKGALYTKKKRRITISVILIVNLHNSYLLLCSSVFEIRLQFCQTKQQKSI